MSSGLVLVSAGRVEEKVVEAVCGYCGLKFTYVRRRYPSGKWNTYRRRYCCNSHRAFGGWRVKAVRKPQGRFKLNAVELRRLYEEGDLSIPDIAAKFQVHPVTVYRRLRELKISGPIGARRIFAPLDKTVFVISVQPLRSLDFEVELKEFLKNRRIPYSLKIYDKTYRNPSQYLQEASSQLWSSVSGLSEAELGFIRRFGAEFPVEAVSSREDWAVLGGLVLKGVFEDPVEISYHDSRGGVYRLTEKGRGVVEAHHS